jgi:peptide chain release factor 1
MNFDIEPLKKEYEEILQEISNPDVISDWEHFEIISKRKKRLEIIFEKNEELNRLERQEKENTNILSSEEEDTELIQLAESELAIVSAEKEKLRKHLKSLIENIDKEEPIIKEGPVIVEIRAGTGGEEAALFAENLFRMYSRYAQTKGWELNILNSNRTELGGLKEIIFELKNGDVYSFMKYEGGVHRVQRIPETEKGGRIHTSTASVIVMLKPKKGKIKIVPAELKIDTYKASGPGGQNVNKRESAIRITHLPTNTVVTSQTERNLAQNKENAMAILEAKILESIEKEQEEKTKKERKEQVSSNDRPEKIRTYNFPQDRITDHRISKNWSNIEKIMDGNLDPVIEELQKELN